jgi:hypothetical protein
LKSLREMFRFLTWLVYVRVFYFFLEKSLRSFLGHLIQERFNISTAVNSLLHLIFIFSSGGNLCQFVNSNRVFNIYLNFIIFTRFAGSTQSSAGHAVRKKSFNLLASINTTLTSGK